MNRERTLAWAALILLIGGAVATAVDIARFGAAVSLKFLSGPTQVAGKPLLLTDDGTRVSLRYGDDEVAADALVRVADPSAKLYHERYTGMVYLARLPRLRQAVAVYFRSRASTADPEPIGQIIVLPRPASSTAGRTTQPDTAQLVAKFREALTQAQGAERPTPLRVSGPVLLLAGLAMFVMAFRTRLPSAPTVLLCIALLVVGSVPGWPLVLGDPVRWSLAGFLSVAVALGAALLLGVRAQQKVLLAGRWSRLGLGAVVGCVLLGVFVAAFVNISGFISPVFRPPDAALSPSQWFFNDLVRPAIALISAGVLPAALCGAIYGARLRAP